MSNMEIDHARTQEQRDQMKEIERLGVCPFCREHFEVHHRHPIVHETYHWLVTKNDYPYEGVEEQLLLVSKVHVRSIVDLTALAWSDLHSVLGWVDIHFPRPGGSLLVRFGDMKYTGATIEHLHAHLIFGNSKEHNTASLKVKVGYSMMRA